MEVILKKTKITNSILKQTLRSTSIDLNVGEILGWCLWGKLKYIVCYRSDIKGLSIFPLFKEIEFGENFNQSERYQNVITSFWVKVKLGGNYIPINYTCSDEDDKKQFIETLNKAKHNAEIRGQFFL